MGININVNFDKCYTFTEIKEDLKFYKFYTVDKYDNSIPLGISLVNNVNVFLPDVYNLAFGPIDNGNNIDDKVEIPHKDLSKVFSTIVFAALTFLAENPGKYIGIDGSNNVRAYMYYKCINNNYDYLSNYFDLFGVNYYVRVLRKIRDSDDHHPIDNDDVSAIPKDIIKSGFITYDKLYNYFIFKLIDN